MNMARIARNNILDRRRRLLYQLGNSCNRRALKSNQLRNQEMQHKNKCSIVTHEDLVLRFRQNVKDASDYVCISCHRMLHRVTVSRFNDQSYPNCNNQLLQKITEHRLKSAKCLEWICQTCHNTLKRGKMPPQATANRLMLSEIPEELAHLNSIEIRLLCLRIPFMKLVGLPRGKQLCIHGPAVNVPSTVEDVCQQFPRLPSEMQMLPLKLKRRMKYKSHYMYDNVRPHIVLQALQWLKKNNPHYKDIKMNAQWENDARNDNEELWNTLTNTHVDERPEDSHADLPDLIPSFTASNDIVDRDNVDNFNTMIELKVPNTDDNPAENNSPSQKQTKKNATYDNNIEYLSNSTPDLCAATSSARNFEEITPATHPTHYSLVSMNGYNLRVHNVPGDGNCQFASISYYLEVLGLSSPDTNPKSLRKSVCKYMSDNATRYKNFVIGRLEPGDDGILDTEQPTDYDYEIAEIENTEEKHEKQWKRYLNDLEYDAWGDNISLKAMADMLAFEIHLHTRHATHIIVIESRCENAKVIHLGIHGQSHYVALADESIPEIHIESAAMEQSKKRVQSDIDEAIEFTIGEQQDEAAFEENATVNGLPHESLLLPDNAIHSKIFNIAPAESGKPIPLLSDKYFEELSNPDKYPFGQNTLTTEREVHLHNRRYFNQRLLNFDGRFAKSVEYLLSAQYAIESQQMHSCINQYIFRRSAGNLIEGQKITAGLLKTIPAIGNFVKTDHAYRFMRDIRGSPPYYQKLFYDVLAMLRQRDIPTFFFTVSAADMQWPDLLQTIARQYGTILTDDDCKNLSFEERSRWLRMNPVTAARHFQYRLELLFRDVLRSKYHPIGEIEDFVIRIEFQARGSPHAHTLLWVKDAPRINVQSDQEICDFIDQVISCAKPSSLDDSANETIFQKLQTHKHSFTCKRKSGCRFGYPKPPSYCTLIARDQEDRDSSPQAMQMYEHAREIVSKVAKIMNTEHGETLNMDQLMASAKITREEYTESLRLAEKGTHVILARDPCEVNVLAYNPTIARAFTANTDLQYIIDPYACIMYMCAYVTKSEEGIGKLLKQASDEYKDKELQKQLRHIGSTFLNKREVSAQEAVYRLLSMPMKKLSRQVVFLNTDVKSARHAMLKPKKQLENLDVNDENVFMGNILIRYAARPLILENLSLAEFAANYTISRNYNDDIPDDSVPVVLEDEPDNLDRNTLPQKIKLIDGKGCMNKRRQEAIIRFHKFNIAKDSSKFYRSKLMLYIPWRNEEVDLLGNYPNFEAHYKAREVECTHVEAKYTKNIELIDKAIEDNHLHGPPEHIWPNLAPHIEQENEEVRNEEYDLLQEMDEQDIQANADMIEQPEIRYHTELSSRYEIIQNNEKLSPPEYRKMMRGLNTEQRHIIFFNRQWCKNAVLAFRNNETPEPYRIFLSGPGGVGKTHVIKLIVHDNRNLLPLCNRMSPTDMLTLLTAPTGVAAFNVGGLTIHSALLLRTGGRHQGIDCLSPEKLNTLRTQMENLQLLVIDEVSMVGSDMLLQIHKRLNEIKGERDDHILFGNLSILAVGDLFQLPPVMQAQIYEPVNHSIARLAGSLWKENFKLHELSQIMRQKDDLSFAELLCRVRTGHHTELDINLLKTRIIFLTDVNYPFNALHVFALNKNVDEWNEKRLNELAPDEKDRYHLQAVDDRTDSTGLLDVSKIRSSLARSRTGGLHTELLICIGARVMVVYNVDTPDGLVNGVIGTVSAVIKNDDGRVLVVLVKFDNPKIGRNAKSTSQWKARYPDSVPITRIEGRYEKASRKGTQVARRQFPLTLAWAVTIHKCQGLTVDEIVVSMKNSKRSFGHGQAYVAFSRVKTMNGLYITDFDADGIKTNKKINAEMDEMRTKVLPILDKPDFLSHNDWITIGHLNIHYFLEKLKDLDTTEESKLLSHTNIMCFTETYLVQGHVIDKFLMKFGYLAFRNDVPAQNDHQGKHGIMICVQEKYNPVSLDLIIASELEYKVVLLSTTHGRLQLCAIYRSPSKPKHIFIRQLEELLNLMSLNVPTVLLGDFNIDLLSTTDSMLSQLMTTNGFKQYVHRPTTDTGTLIDHIYLNKTPSNYCVDIHDVYYSDHDSVFISFDELK